MCRMSRKLCVAGYCGQCFFCGDIGLCQVQLQTIEVQVPTINTWFGKIPFQDLNSVISKY